MTRQFVALVFGVLAGVLIGAVLMQFVGLPVTGTSVPSHGVSTATGCQSPADTAGWVGVVPHGEYRTVHVGNLSVEHGATDIELRATLTETGPGAWTLAMRTSVVGDRSAPVGCQPRTLIDATVALPRSAEQLTVTLDGEPVTVVETTTNEPQFTPLAEGTG